MNDVIRKITDVVTIIFPAVISCLGVFHLTGIASTVGTVEQVVLIALGAASAIASVIYNKVSSDSN